MLTDLGNALPPWAMLGMILVASMLLSAVINNAAAVILMAPVGVGVASTLGASSDPFLMAVAIGGSSAFLSPIGHQSNTIVMGPGGYRFGDYLRMGLPMVVVIVAVAVPPFDEGLAHGNLAAGLKRILDSLNLALEA